MAELKKINDTTFSADDLGDVKPKVKIGGNDEKKFIPNLNASFFDDEFYFNLNRKDKAGVSTAIEAKITGDDTGEWYIDKDGRLKWDVVFDSCPENLTLEWELKYKSGIEFIYQGELTEQEIKDGCVRPDEVVGSYAVYCNKANNKYKTGKLTHIYRPFVVDAEGSKEWATLLIEKGKLTITLPEKFINSAKYPVRLDPTFGYNSVGGSSDYWSNTKASKATGTPAGNGTLDSISVYGASSDGARTRFALYSDNSGAPNTRLDYDSTGIFPNSTAGWWTSNAMSYSVTSGTQYHLSFTGSGSFTFRYDYGAGELRTHSSEVSICPDPWGSGSTYNQRISIYATYTESGGETILPQIVHHMKQQGIM